MHFPCLKIVVKQGGDGGEKKRAGWGEKEKERERKREKGGEREREREEEEEVLWASSPSHCLSGMLITSCLPVQPGDGYVSSEHLLFEISVLALFLRKISTSVFFHL